MGLDRILKVSTFGFAHGLRFVEVQLSTDCTLGRYGRQVDAVPGKCISREGKHETDPRGPGNVSQTDVINSRN